MRYPRDHIKGTSHTFFLGLFVHCIPQTLNNALLIHLKPYYDD